MDPSEYVSPAIVPLEPFTSIPSNPTLVAPYATQPLHAHCCRQPHVVDVPACDPETDAILDSLLPLKDLTLNLLIAFCKGTCLTRNNITSLFC